MIFNQHSALVGTHSLLSPSSYHWVNYDDDKLTRMFHASMAASRGVELHAFAHNAIRLGIRLPTRRTTLNMYVNDAIGYKMRCEQLLVYSQNCYGSADTISFRRNVLRIHDLKTGVREASVKQLEVYAALFCLEYGYKPRDIQIELKIYQNDDTAEFDVDISEIERIMECIVDFDKRINQLRLEAAA